MKFARWIIGCVVLVVLLALIVFRPAVFGGTTGSDTSPFTPRVLYIVILASVMCLFRVLRGPTAADRIVAIDIFGVLIVGFCAVASIGSGRSWYIDIGIAWALQSFIGTLALCKYLEGRGFDE